MFSCLNKLLAINSISPVFSTGGSTVSCTQHKGNCIFLCKWNMHFIMRHLLGVECSVWIIKSPDHIVCKPGASYNCAEAWERKGSDNRDQSVSQIIMKTWEAFFFLSRRTRQLDWAEHGQHFSALIRAPQTSNVRISARGSASVSLMTCGGPGQQRGMKASLLSGSQKLLSGLELKQ